MAENTKSLKTDVNAQPAPQYFNPIMDDYEYVFGRLEVSVKETVT